MRYLVKRVNYAAVFIVRRPTALRFQPPLFAWVLFSVWVISCEIYVIILKILSMP